MFVSHIHLAVNNEIILHTIDD